MENTKGRALRRFFLPSSLDSPVWVLLFLPDFLHMYSVAALASCTAWQLYLKCYFDPGLNFTFHTFTSTCVVPQQ